MTGKFRHRVHGKSIVRVKKGMTCESNPTKRRHRSAATASRNAAVAPLIAVDDLPVTDGHDEKIIDDLPMENMSLGKDDPFSSNRSMISEGGLSRLTTFTSCTNPTFDAVHRIWKSGSSLQTEVAAVLAAVAELIKERNGTETDVEYFAALLSTLDSTPKEDTARIAATAYLLHLIVKKVPKEVLQSQFSKTVQVIYTKLLENAETNDGAVLKNLLTVLGVVFRAQPAAVWNSANTRNMVVSVSALCTHDKPWVRTMSRRVVRAVLTDPVTALDNGLHAAAGPVGQFLHSQLESCIGQKNGTIQTTRYLCLLEGIMHKMPSNVFKELAETILKGFAFAVPTVKCAALQCIYRALQRQPCDAALPTETNALLILSLRGLEPPPSDVAVCAYWMQALVEAHVCLTGKDALRSDRLLAATMTMLVKMFDTGDGQLSQILNQVLSRIIERCVQDNEVSSRCLLSLLEEALTLQSTLVWKHILKTMGRLFETAGSALLGEEFVKCLRTLAALREGESCFCKQDVEFTIGAAVRYVGVQHVLTVLSLNIDPEMTVLSTDLKRSWLLPIFRVNIRNAPISLFVKYFLPLAIKIYRRLPSLDTVVARIYQVIQNQLWDLLPAFLESPADFEEGFSQLAQVLGAALNERKDLRLTILSSLRSALKFALQPSAPVERLEVMSRYAKNFMPMLFNMYTNNGTEDNGYEDRGVRLATLDTLRLYVNATPSELLTKYADSAIGKIKEAEEGSAIALENRRSRILDILAAIVKAADGQTVEKILDVVNSWFHARDTAAVQKKSFRILEEVLQRRSDSALDSIFAKEDSFIENAVLKPYESIAAPARAAHQSAVRLTISCMEDYLKLNEFCIKTLSVTVMCLDKSNSMPCRANASKCMQDICSRLIETGSELEHAPSAVLSPILDRIYEMSTPTNDETEIKMEVARATLVALNIVAQKRIKVLNGSHISRLVSHGCAMLSDSREPVRILAIRLVRVLMQKMPEFAIHQYRQLVLTSFFDGQPPIEDHSSKVRKANRLLLEVLVEKFSVPVLEKYTDKFEWTQQMKNIEKIKRRKARKESGEAAQPGDESDDDGMSLAGSRVSARTAGADTILNLLEDSDDDGESDGEMMESKSRTGSVWLKEDADAVVDLLDRKQLINKVTTIDPSLVAKRQARLAAKKSNNGGFSLTKDGKLVIDMEDSDDDTNRGGKRKRGQNDDLADLLTDSANGTEKKRKVDSDDDNFSDLDDDMDRKTTVSKVTGVSQRSGKSGWKPGGQGIHRDTSRPIAKATKRNAPKQRSDFKKKGQKLEPYAYVPLRQKKGQKQDLKTFVGKRKGMNKGRKGTSTVGSSV